MGEHDDDLDAREPSATTDAAHVAAAVASGLSQIAAALERGLGEIAAAIVADAGPRRRARRKR